jgi:hypothetical protein
MTMEITLEHRRLPPGGVVRGTVTLEPLPGDEGNRVELSVLWETAGKGDTDLGIVLFRQLEGRGSFPFEAPLPLLPLSYDGGLLSISWLVRVRRLRTLAADEIVDELFKVEAAPP